MVKTKTELLQKLLCGFLSLLLLFVFIVPVSASETLQESAESEPILVSRTVYPEVTDWETLLEMALEQESCPAVAGRSIAARQSDEITVKQLLEERTYSDGSVEEVYAQTSLLVLDEEGKKLTRSGFEHSSKTGNNYSKNVLASQTAYIVTEKSQNLIRIAYVTTTVSEMGTATPVTSFIHAITKNEYGEENVINQERISSPQMGKAYTYYNPTLDFYPLVHMATFLQTGAEIFLADGSSFEVIVVVK